MTIFNTFSFRLIIKHFIFALIVPFTIISCSPRKLINKGIYHELPSSEFAKLLKQENINIIDVRTESEYTKSHIHRAINASYLSGKFSRIVNDSKLDVDKPTLIYCETQHRSLFAAKKLYKLGFKNIIDLDKGMMYWRKHSFPYERGKSYK